MRSELVLTNETCNQNCVFCTARRSAEDPAFIRGAAVKARIDRAIADGAREIVLSGGEPTMRRDLAGIIDYCRQRGAESIVLETNATLVDSESARGLAAAGLHLARVHLDGGSAAVDAVTRDEGGFRRTLAGLRALLDAGLRVEVATAIIRSSLPLIAALPAALQESVGDLRKLSGLVVSIPVSGPPPAELVSYEEAGEVVAQLSDAAKKLGLTVRMSSNWGMPPCVLPERSRHAHLYALNPGGSERRGYVRLPTCTDCRANDRCPGIMREYLEHHPLPASRPITDDRLRRRLSLATSAETQIARELVTINRRQIPGQAPVEDRIVRVNFHCNQACRFCFVSTHLPAAQEQQIRDAIVAAGQSGARVTLSGGEPTLNARLPEYVRLAKEHTKHPVELQTNATRLEDPQLVQKLVEAGLDEVFVSLHGSAPEISDAITEAPGTFVKTVAGLDNLAKTELAVVLNFVFCRRNHRDFVNVVRLVADRWPRAILNVSFVAASTDVVPRDHDLIPRYRDVMPELQAGYQLAQERGLRIVGFEGMCGIPLCLVPGSLEQYFLTDQLPDGFDAGEFIKPAPCTGCSLRTRCYGIRRGYVELYDTSELQPVAARA